MSKASFYVGIDVGSQELVAAVENRKPRSFKHSRAGIKAMIKWAQKLAPETPLHFCLEATGVYGYSLACRLHQDHQVTVSVINPAQIASYAKAQLRRTKTDNVDARVIHSFAQSQNPRVWKPESSTIRQLYYLVVEADRIGKTMGQWNNRKHGHKYLNDLPQIIKQTNKALQRAMTRQLEKIEQAILELCQQNKELKQDVQLLCSIPGVANHSAVRILAYGKNTLRDFSRNALTAHAGLAPGQKQSGTSIHGKSRIAKQGDSRLRKTLYMPALVAAYHNPTLKLFYQRLLENGKPKMVAIVAVMKKLLLMIQAILKKKIPYGPNFALDS
ncbi:MAG: IS110 family transposase [Candidatus Zixiibacteriota bacterium]